MSPLIDNRIVVTFQIEGFHCWPDAPDKHAYLRNRHRHVFHFRVEKIVEHRDRDIEFIDFKRKLKSWYFIEPWDFQDKSCETIATELLIAQELTKVEVMEDGENGAIVTRVA